MRILHSGRISRHKSARSLCFSEINPFVLDDLLQHAQHESFPGQTIGLIISAYQSLQFLEFQAVSKFGAMILVPSFCKGG